MQNTLELMPIAGHGFGGVIDARNKQQDLFDQVFAMPNILSDMFDRSGGLLLIKGLTRTDLLSIHRC